MLIIYYYHVPLLTASEARREATVGGMGRTLVPMVGLDSLCDACDVLLQT